MTSVADGAPAGAIDCHAHLLPPGLLAWLRSSGDEIGLTVTERDGGGLHVRARDRAFPFGPELYDPGMRKEWMEERGIAAAVFSPPPWLFLYELDAPLGAQLCRRFNEIMAEEAKLVGDACHGMALLPLQDIELALRELDFATETLGLRAVEMGCRIRDDELDAERLEPFYTACAERGTVLYLHPFVDPLVLGSRLRRYHMVNLVGVPTETTIGAAHLVLGGVLARHPRLLVLLSHAGGAVPMLLGRWDHGHNVRSDARMALAEPPSTSARQLYFDSVSHGPKQLELLLEVADPTHLVLGTDQPYDMATAAPFADLGAVLDPPQLARTARTNAAKLFGLD